MKFFIFVLFLSLTAMSTAHAETSNWGRDLFLYFRPLSSNDPQFLRTARNRVAERCDEEILDIQLNIYILETANKSYYSSVHKNHLSKVIQECAEKIRRFDEKIASLKAP